MLSVWTGLIVVISRGDATATSSPKKLNMSKFRALTHLDSSPLNCIACTLCENLSTPKVKKTTVNLRAPKAQRLFSALYDRVDDSFAHIYKIDVTHRSQS